MNNLPLRTRKSSLAIAAALALGVWPAPPALAASCTWNPATGNWGIAGNWSCALVPGIGDDASISLGKVVTIDTAQSVRNLTNAGGVNIDAFLLTLSGAGGTTNTGAINIGGPSTASLQVSAGHNIINTGGVINIANGSVLNQFGSQITGGTINSTGTGKLVVFSNPANFLNGATFNGNLDMASVANSRQRVSTGGLVLNGIVDLNNNGILSFEGDGVLSGSGSIVLGATGAGNRIDLDGTGTTTFASGSTVRGQNGTIGLQINIGGTQTLLNNGLISADVAGGTITITQSAVTNNGTLQAINGGTLVLNSGVTGGMAGQIIAGAGSVVRQEGVTISGTINTSGSGLFTVSSNGANFLNGATFNGLMDMASVANSRQRVSTGGLVLNGIVDLNNNGILSFEGDGALSGSGSIVLGATGAGNRIDLDGTGTTTFVSGSTVRGQNGTIGLQLNIGGTQTLVNNGLISADVAGGTITITESAVTNNGTLQAINGGTLVLNSGVTGGMAGQIIAGAGSVVRQQGVTISGTINTSGSGLFTVSSNGFNLLDGVTFNGNLDMASVANSRQRVSTGGLVLNGIVDLNNNGILSFEGTSMLGGTGSIVFGDTGAGNRIDLDGTGTTTFASGSTVRGQNGTIGQQINIGGTQTLLNNGLISADVAGGTITITQSAVTNNGTLQAINGGTLVLNSGVTGGLAGQIIAGAGSVVRQEGVTISGTINTSGSGLFTVSSNGANFLNGVTFNGNLDMASVVNSRQRVSTGGLVLNGIVDLNNNGILSFEGDGVLSGSGSIVLGATGAGNRIDLDGTGTTTFASGSTVRGQNGTIGLQLNIGGTQTLVNNGLISADVAGGTITITQSAVTNNHRLEAKNGATLVLGSDVTNGGSGVILADNGVVLQSGVRVTGGTIASANGGVFRVTSSAANFLDSVTLTGVMDMASVANSRQRVNNGFTVDGTVNINSNGILGMEGTSTLGGSGSIVLGSTGAGNRIDLEGSGTTTFAAGLTVRGHSGTIGQQLNIGGTQTLVNNGMVNADEAGGTISFVESALENNGLVRAQAGAVNVSVPLSGSGTLQVDAAGVMNLASGAKTQGSLLMGNTGAVLNIGTGNLTINTDYTNAGAGSGNSFDRRAGISGAGLVVSGGDATQAITGAHVTNGATPSATLTIGSVRVGSTTFNYQVANTGSTGPTLRGALQTSVNGGNITDPRLSGSGVTASNYAAPIAGSSGDLALNFSVASAGPIAGLVGQALNLHSNFSNIADQKLNIVLGAGAAAYNAAVGSTTPTPAVVVSNQRVGGSNSAPLTVANIAPAGAFSEDLIAAFGSNTGAATNNGGSIAGLLAGANNNSAMAVGVNTTGAGAQTGSVTLNYQTAGAVNGVSNGLGVAGAGSQMLSVGGNVYQLAAGQILSAPLNFGTVQVGQVVSQALTLGNIASGPSGFVEDLNAAFGTSTDPRISGAGSISGVHAGSTSAASGSGAMTVNVDTSAVGTVSGAIRVNFSSAGAVMGASNGLGTFGVGFESYAVNGMIEASVIGTAKPVTNGVVSPGTVTVSFGNLRIGTTASQNLSVLNQATGGDQAALNASIAGSAHVSTAGSINLLLPGATSNALQVGVAGTTPAGPLGGSATISFVSDASNIGGCAPSCTLALPSQTVNLAGAVYRLANPLIDTPALTIAARVGDAVAANRAVTISNSSPDAFTEGLNVSFSGTTGNAQHNGGSITNLGAGLANSTALKIGLANTATAGITGNSVQLAFVSTGAGTTGAPDVPATTPAGSVNLTAKVYTPAIGEVTAPLPSGSPAQPTLDFGTVRVGDAVAPRSFTITNTAAITALNDTLRAELSTLGGPFTQSGPITGLAALASAPFSIGLATGAAGVFAQGGTVSTLSQNPDMADVSGGADTAVRVLATINNLANADFDQLVGAGVLSQSGSDYVLDLGTVALGGGFSVVLGLDNDVLGPADELSGSFDLSSADDFGYAGWNPITSPLAAGDGVGGLTISFTALGAYEDTIVFNGLGTNVSDAAGLAQTRRLLIRANLVDPTPGVPEPSTLMLLLGAAAATLVARRRARLVPRH